MANLGGSLMQRFCIMLAVIWSNRRGSSELWAATTAHPGRLGLSTGGRQGSGVGGRLIIDATGRVGGLSTLARPRREEARNGNSSVASEATKDREPLGDRCPQGREAPTKGWAGAHPRGDSGHHQRHIGRGDSRRWRRLRDGECHRSGGGGQESRQATPSCSIEPWWCQKPCPVLAVLFCPFWLSCSNSFALLSYFSCSIRAVFFWLSFSSFYVLFRLSFSGSPAHSVLL
jgi:hypothetical protein